MELTEEIQQELNIFQTNPKFKPSNYYCDIVGGEIHLNNPTLQDLVEAIYEEGKSVGRVEGAEQMRKGIKCKFNEFIEILNERPY
jgi:hypothetical protein